MVRVGGWLAEQHAADQRRFMNLLVGSFIVHAVLVGLLSMAPIPDAPALPEVLRVDLVAALPTAAPARPRPRRPAPIPPAPKPPPSAPAPAPPAPTPVPPAPKQVVLPKQAPKAIPKRRVAPALKPRPEPVQYEDALSQLREELGETAPPVAPVEEAPAPAEEAPPEDATSSLDRENAEWMDATRRHVRSKYITPPEFLNRPLATGLEVVLTSRGELVGMPRVVRPSGDPFFDDNAVRAVMMSAPLPPPPRVGAVMFFFTTEDR